MATLAETLIQGVQRGISENNPDIAGAIRSGSELALKQEQMQAQRLDIEQQKVELQNSKITKFSDAINKSSKLDPATRKLYMKQFVPRLRDALGLTDMFPDDTLQFVTSTDQNLARVASLQSQIRQGQITQEEAIATLQDPEKFVDITPEIITVFGKAETTSVIAKAQATKQRDQQEFTRGEKVAESSRIGKEAVTRKFSEDYLDYKVRGGRATVDKNLGLFEAAIKELEGRDEIASSLTAGLPGIGGDTIQAKINPKLTAVGDKIRSAVMGTLRQTLGSAFTDAEGQRIFNLAFNPSLSDKENTARAKVQLDYLKKTLRDKDAAVKFFEKQGSLEGFSGTPKEQLTLDSYGKLSDGAKQLLQKKLGKSEAEIKQMLGGK